jgi:hypothetical protein
MISTMAKVGHPQVPTLDMAPQEFAHPGAGTT